MGRWGRRGIVGCLFGVVAATLVLLPCVGGGDAFSEEIGPGFARFSGAYHAIRDLTGRFEQKSVLKELEREDRARGRFRAILPDRLLWIHETPRRQETELAGTRVRVRQEGSGEVFERVLDTERYGSLPMAMLMGPDVFAKDFIVTEPRENTLELRPRNPVPGIRLITILLGPDDGTFPLRDLVVEDRYGNVNTFTFTEVVVNADLDGADVSLSPGDRP